jgi:beta-glucosidase/6-phospho-beta-glucosidase/beta-galactosidase
MSQIAKYATFFINSNFSFAQRKWPMNMNAKYVFKYGFDDNNIVVMYVSFCVQIVSLLKSFVENNLHMNESAILCLLLFKGTGESGHFCLQDANIEHVIQV